MKKVSICKILASIMVFLFAFKVHAMEISTSNLDEVKAQLEKLQPGDLLVSDVIGVIYYPGDKLLFGENKKMYKAFLDDIEKRDGLHTRQMLEGIVKQSYVPVVVSDDLISYMQDVVNRDVKFVILTSAKTGELGPINELMDLRNSRLQQIGLDLGGMFDVSTVTLDKVSDSKNGKHPIYKDGTIFVNRNDKGDTLAAFLDEVEFIPNKVVFVDNKKSKIDSVRKACENRGVDFVGIHFTKVYEIAAEPGKQDVMQKQLFVLETQKKWLTDDQAKCIVDNNDDRRLCLNNS